MTRTERLASLLRIGETDQAPAIENGFEIPRDPNRYAVLVDDSDDATTWVYLVDTPDEAAQQVEDDSTTDEQYYLIDLDTGTTQVPAFKVDTWLTIAAELRGAVV